MSLIAGNLGVVQRMLDAQQMMWAVCGGAAAHLYGDRRPLQDIDIVVTPGQLPVVVKLLQQQQKAVQFDGSRILWRGIKVLDNLSIRREGMNHPFVLDTLAQSHLRRIPLLGARVAVLAPEDVLMHKVLLGRGPEQNKYDIADAAGITRRQPLDLDYLRQRIELMHAATLAPKILEQVGVAL